MRRAFEEELKKTPSGQSGKTPASRHQKTRTMPARTPRLLQSEGCTLPAVSPWRAPWQTHTRGRESRSENSRHLAGGRCDNSLAEHETKSNFKISNRHLTALKTASLALVCLYNALRGRMRELGSTDVMGTYCSAGRCGANPRALSSIQTLLGCLVHHFLFLPAKKLYMVAHVKLNLMWH